MSSTPAPVLAETGSAPEASRPITSSICRRTPFGLGRRQVDLVEHRDDLQIGIKRQIDVGQRLRLDALGGVDHQQRAFAGGERPADLVGEIDMARRVHQVEKPCPAVRPGPFQAHGLGLDGDAALALQVHAVQDLLLHLPVAQPAGLLDQPVRQRRLAVIDVGDDRKIADLRDVGRGSGHRGGAGGIGGAVAARREVAPHRRCANAGKPARSPARREIQAQPIRMPPEMEMVWPVMPSDSGEAR